MTVIYFLKLYIIALPTFLLIDLLWLGVVAREWYQDQLGTLLRNDTQWVPAIIFYLLFVGGVVFFVLNPAFGESMSSLVLRAGFFGLVTYATYELTNSALIVGWPKALVYGDIAWGIVLTILVATITTILVQFFWGL